jgi:ribonuclease D
MRSIRTSNTVRRQLGGSDWSHTDLSPAHYVHMAEDVGYLPALWTVLEQALREAQLDAPFRERMRFFPHLNQIKVTGIPIDVGQRDAGLPKSNRGESHSP